MFSRMLLASSVIVTGMNFNIEVAQADTIYLHELLFNRSKRKQREVKKVEQPEKKIVKRKIKRVAGPRYYTYKAPQMATLTLAGLTTAATGTSSDNSFGAPSMDFETQRFKEAVRNSPTMKMMVESDIAKAVTDHYSTSPRFIWSQGTSITKEARQLAEMLNQADQHGLLKKHYALSIPQDGFELTAQVERATELLKFEMTLTAHAIRFAMDMKDGVINPNKISGYHDFSMKRLSAAEALKALTSNSMSAADYVASLIPQQPHYAQLQSELQTLRSSTQEDIVFPEKLLMKPERESAALPTLMKAIDRKIRDETRLKHKAVIDEYEGSLAYEGDIVELVRDVQRDLGLVPDGIVGPKTVSRLGGQSLATKVKRVEMALERLRWHPEQYGKRQVLINQPEYRVRYLENNQTKLAMRAVVGKPSNQTNFFHDEIETVVFNPYWGVPQSIIVNEMLPRLQRDPGYLDRAGYVVTTAGGKRVASSNVNWYQYAGPVPFNVRQKPGPRNALGELKILFPNKHAIYMHDTPAKNLFARDSRAYSHGCIRLEDPRAMAAAVLGKDKAYIRSQLGGSERAEKVSEKIPVFVSYFTAWPNDEGTVEYHPDVYKRDNYLGKAFDAVHGARDQIG